MNKNELELIAKNLVNQFAIKEINDGYNLTGLHPYNDNFNNLIYFKIRLKHPNGKKWIRPFHFNSNAKEWSIGEPTFSNKKPLYCLPIIIENPDGEVWILEGEQKVEALKKFGLIGTTSGGCTTVEETDFEPLKNRKIIIWPDNDHAGLMYAEALTKKLLSINCTIKWVNTKELTLPNKGDIIDWLNSKIHLTEKEIKEDLFSLTLIEPFLTGEYPSQGANLTTNPESGINDIFLSYRHANEIEMRPYDWLWPNRFACGKVSMITGHPGLGKSQLTANMASIITRGDIWPDGTKSNPGRVIILSAEDDAADTIVPRLCAAGADLNKVTIVDAVIECEKNGNQLIGQFNLATDLDILEALLIKLGDVNALFIDPLSAYLGNTDDHKNSRVRSVLTPLAKLAEKYNIAIICISHNNKNSNQEALLRVIGSIGFVAASRAAFAVVKNKEDNNLLFLPLKNNIGNDKTGLSFQIEPYTLNNDIQTSRIKWSNEIITLTADEVMNALPGNDEKSPIKDAEDFLLSILSTGPKQSSAIKELAEAEMVSDKTLRRAKKNLNIQVGREGFGKGSKPFWYLPPKTDLNSIDGHTHHTFPSKNMAAYDENDQVCDN